MKNIPKPLADLRDEAVRKILAKVHDGSDHTILKSLEQAWDAALTALSEASGEFDENAAVRAISNADNLFDTSNDFSCFTEGARWQFEQSAARVGMAEGAQATAKYERGRADSWCARYKELYECVKVEPLHSKIEREIKSLEARLAESERALAHFHENKGWTANYVVQRLHDKLAAAEADKQQLHTDWTGQLIHINRLEARVKELEIQVDQWRRQHLELEIERDSWIDKHGAACAERDRLRAALDDIGNGAYDSFKCGELARKALRKK